MAGELLLRVFDVEHGACAIMLSPTEERLAMIDSGDNTSTHWRPSTYIREVLGRKRLDYLFVTNADLDHISDLDGLWENGIEVGTLIRNPSPDAATLRLIKLRQGELTTDIERFLAIHEGFSHPVAVPFNDGMSGVTCATFWNTYPEFDTTNNLSLVVFIKYAGFNILFPGDLERDGWLALLRNPSFVQELATTEILVASHHGRESGFCEKIFSYFRPRAIVISDKPIQHETQDIDYSPWVQPDGVIVTNQARRRHILTTRKDGDILFRINAAGQYWITTFKG